MRIADFNKLPIGTKVIYKRSTYTLIDRIRQTHEAVLSKNRHGGKLVIRCSEIQLTKKGQENI